jgi:hypothetical protein
MPFHMSNVRFSLFQHYIRLFTSIFLCFLPLSFAFEPQSTPTPELQETLGVVALQSPLMLYDAPTFNSRILDELTWEFTPSSAAGGTLIVSHATNQPMATHEFFMGFSPQEQLAFLPVINELETGWLQVQVPHLMNRTVWVSPAQQQQPSKTVPNRFMTWQQFMAHFSKQYGFHWLQGTPQEMKSVHTQPDEATPLTKVTFVQSMRPLHVRGNWLLVEMRDVAEERPIGWMRWRTEEGNILVWPNFDKRQALYQAPSNPLNPQAIFERF